MITIPLSLSDRHSCSYLENQLARTLFVHPSFELDTHTYEQLLAQGFRRSGDDVYRPECEICNACVPVRIEVASFKPSKSQKRCLDKNKSTGVIIKASVFEEAHYHLYMRYQNGRHAQGAMAESDRKDYLDFLASTWGNTLFVEFIQEEKLMALAVVDKFENALSAVYTFFDPEFSDISPGVYAVLWQVEYAKQLGLEFVYLGYWIKQCRKMSYKINYQPLQQFVDKAWIALPASEKS